MPISSVAVPSLVAFENHCLREKCEHTSRKTQGGTTAVLSPLSTLDHERKETLEGELCFQNDDGAVARYCGKNVDALTGCVVVIQLVPVSPMLMVHVSILTRRSEHGDLSQPSTPGAHLHQFVFRPSMNDVSALMDLDRELNLGVGGDVIIGRRISVFRDESLRTDLAEGNYWVELKVYLFETRMKN